MIYTLQLDKFILYNDKNTLHFIDIQIILLFLVSINDKTNKSE